MIYKEEKIAENIKHILDTPENREYLTMRLGEAEITTEDYTYIEVDMVSKTWRTCFTFEWLYRDAPNLVHTDILGFDFWSECAVCGTNYKNMAGSSPCCGSLMYSI